MSQGASICSNVPLEQTISGGASLPHCLHRWLEGVQVCMKTTKTKGSHYWFNVQSWLNLIWCQIIRIGGRNHQIIPVYAGYALYRSLCRKAIQSLRFYSEEEQVWANTFTLWWWCVKINILRTERDSKWLWSLKQELNKPLLSSLNNWESIR